MSDDDNYQWDDCFEYEHKGQAGNGHIELYITCSQCSGRMMRVGDTYICEQCGDDLGRIGNQLGPIYNCGECGEKMIQVKNRWVCRNCDTIEIEYDDE